MINYPGLSYIGSGKISGLYGLNATIHDQKSNGLQHLYVGDYQRDYIYSALTVLKANRTCYYGDRIKPALGHATCQASQSSHCQDGFQFIDQFAYRDFKKVDSAYCADDYQLCFYSDVTNTSTAVQDIELSALLITTAADWTLVKRGTCVHLTAGQQHFIVQCQGEQLIHRLAEESPSGFTYHGIQNILYDTGVWQGDSYQSQQSVALSIGCRQRLAPGESHRLQWSIQVSDAHDDCAYRTPQQAAQYWESWLATSAEPIGSDIVANLIALRAINLDGFVPADLTGHYFANCQVAFYTRDALHAARALMLAGFNAECKAIFSRLKQLARKANNELYQRYNAILDPDEGANNDVFSQIDVIGYTLSIVADYYDLYGDLLMDIQQLRREVSILDSVQNKHGLYGPEGGVNEGVYGPAFITSTNLMIAAGLYRLCQLFTQLDVSPAIIDQLKRRFDDLQVAINRTFLADRYFAYGYVSYHDNLVKRYDTPQLFGLGLGYPADRHYIDNFNTLSHTATYFGYGYGYSEQEYHDGPWLFNTCYAAENALILGDADHYDKIMAWIAQHKNAYGLLPEAIDARDERRPLINPLMWANAEYVSAKQAHRLVPLRGGETR